MYTIETHPDYSYVKIVKIPFANIDKIDFALCNQPTETPDAYYKRQSRKPDIVTNGGFFSMSNGNTCMSFRDEGVTICSDTLPGVAIYGDIELFYSFLQNCSDCRDFIAAYPALVVDGVSVSIGYAKELDYNARRTCVGWSEDMYYIVTVDSPGLKYSALQKIFTELGAKYAINLDGGGSTRLLVDGERKTSQIYARPVDNVMCVYLNKESAAPTLYRVQVGAFLCRQNAERLQEELASNGFPDSFIKKIGLYYKVQLGAFSVRLNAERLRDRLKAAGYSAFIATE